MTVRRELVTQQMITENVETTSRSRKIILTPSYSNVSADKIVNSNNNIASLATILYIYCYHFHRNLVATIPS